jgi:mono/diheme cytochrome c family protein
MPAVILDRAKKVADPRDRIPLTRRNVRISGNMKKISAFAILIFWGISVAGPALAQVSLADAKRGQELAARLCSGCHIVSPGSATTANPDIPTFSAIAGRADTTSERLAGRIIVPHPPMPNTQLTMAEIRDIIAYIMSLKPSR